MTELLHSLIRDILAVLVKYRNKFPSVTKYFLFPIRRKALLISAKRISNLQQGFIKITKRGLILTLCAWMVILGSGYLYLFKFNRKTEAAWFNEDWSYRQSIPVTNTGSNQTNYTVPLTYDTATPIAAGKMQSNCADIRITDVAGKILPHNILSGCNSSTTTILVSMNSVLTAGTTFYIYYGNPSALSTSTTVDSSSLVDDGDGADGAITISSSTNINTANTISGRSCADGGDGVNYSVSSLTSTTAVLTTTPSAGCLIAGDEILLINLQGAGNSAVVNVGNYETLTISSVSTNTITFSSAKTKFYGTASNNDLNLGTATSNQRVMLQRVPNYTNVTVNSTFNASAWDGTKGGVMFFRASGTVTVNTGGSINMTGLGYRGGQAVDGSVGNAGESYGALGTLTTNANLGGGGGTGQACCNGSGGGGGYGTAGATKGWGLAGGTYGSTTLPTLFLGSGGGSGTVVTPGGSGAGIIYVSANTLTVAGSGSIVNGGASGSSGSNGQGGGGSGGSTYIAATTATLGSSLVTASGGAGGVMGGSTAGNVGGVGRIKTQTLTSTGTTSPAANTTLTVPNITVGSPATEEKAPSPVAYWKFDDGTGTTAQDSTSSNKDGTLSGATAPAWQDDNQCISGKCLYFDGSTSYVNVGSIGIDNYDDLFSFSGWYRFNDVSQTKMLFSNNSGAAGDTGEYNAWSYVSSAAKIVVDVHRAQSTDATLTSNTTIENGKWYHITIVYTGNTGTLSLYINGKLDKSVAVSFGGVPTAADDWVIGAQGGTTKGSAPLKGFADDIKIYKYARSAAQIQTDYNNRSGGDGSGSVLGATNQKALSDGLVGYWKMDESSGNAVDSSGNSFTGTPTGTSVAAGKFGNARSFPGTSNNYISIANNTALSPTTSGFSVSTWVYPTSTSGSNHIISKDTSVASTRSYYLVQNSNTFIWCMWFSSSQLCATSSTFTANSWYHVTGTYDGSTLTIYVNGIASGTQAVTGTPQTNTNTLMIGTTALINSCCYFPGYVDEARIYQKSLSPSDVTMLYNFAPGPIAYYNMDERSGTTIKDLTGNGFNSTLTGNTRWDNGKYGSALNFDGSGDFTSYTLGTPSKLKLTNAFSMGFWMYGVGSSADAGLVGTDIGAGYQCTHHLGATVYCYIHNGTTQTTVSTTVGRNVWKYIAVTWDGTTGTNGMKMYVDGVLTSQATSSISAMAAWSTLKIGRTTGAFGSDYSGKIDDVKIYDYVRTAKQVVEDMNGGHPNVGSPVASALGHWDFDEGYGTLANNRGSQGSTLNGTLTGMASPATATSGWTQSGKFGKGLLLDGTSDYISIANIVYGTSFATSAWIKTTATSLDTNLGVIIEEVGSATNEGYQCQMSTEGGQVGKIRFYVSDATNTVNTYSTSTVNDGNWHHIVCMKDGTTARIFIDGKPNGTGNLSTVTGTIDATTGGTRIGALRSGTNQEFSGSIDEIKVYNYALTDAEVRTDYNKGSSLILGSTITGSSQYCVPGDSSTCTAPVGEWNFEERSGITANDSSGNANTGTLTLGPRWTTGKDSAGLSFDGSDDYVTISDSSSLDITPSITLSSWINSGSTLNSVESIIGKRDASATEANYGLRTLNDEIDFFWSNGGTFQRYLTSNADLSTNAWYHLAVTYDGTNVKIYKNGQLLSGSCVAGTCNNALAADNNTVGIGKSGDFAGELFSGSIDQVRVFNYARTPAQIAWDYNKGKPVAHWDFDECQGSTLNDRSGFGNTGTWSGASGGSQTSVGTCTASGTTAWYQGRTGKVNYSMNFDGTDDYISLSSSSVFDMPAGGGKTFATWIKTTTDGRGILQLQSTGGNPLFYLQVGASTSGGTANKFVTYIRDNGGTNSKIPFSGTTTVNDGIWHHVAFVVDGNNLYLYVDGKQDASSTWTSGAITISGGGTYRIGDLNHASNYEFNGQIDDFRIYNYPLTPTQIKDIYNGGAVRFGPLTGSP